MTLKEYLSTRRIGQSAFARSIGVSQQVVNKWALGRACPRRDAMTMIIKATRGEVTANDFVFREPPQVPNEAAE
jgi:DNA-binding transcriptional regulator YdaS (Cro superfamily)